MESACAELDLLRILVLELAPARQILSLIKYVATLKRRKRRIVASNRRAQGYYAGAACHLLVTSSYLVHNTTSFTALRQEASKARLRVTTVTRLLQKC